MNISLPTSGVSLFRRQPQLWESELTTTQILFFLVMNIQEEVWVQENEKLMQPEQFDLGGILCELPAKAEALDITILIFSDIGFDMTCDISISHKHISQYL